MVRKRKSDPIPPTRRVHLPSSETTATSVTSNEELEKLVQVIHEKFKKKTKEQQKEAEQHIKEAVGNAMSEIQGHVESYELQMQQELEKLCTGLENVQKERLDQVTLFKGKYREMKDEMHSLIKTVESHDAQYATLKETFFTAAHQIEKEIRKAAKESLAVVPTSSTRSIKKARH